MRNVPVKSEGTSMHSEQTGNLACPSVECKNKRSAICPGLFLFLYSKERRFRLLLVFSQDKHNLTFTTEGDVAHMSTQRRSTSR